MKTLRIISTCFVVGLILGYAYVCFASDTYKLQVVTKDQTEIGEYTDAQYFTCADSQTLADCKASHQAEIDAERTKRLSNYVQAVKNPVKPIEPSKEELQEAKAQLMTQIAELDAKIMTAKPKVIAEVIE